MVETRREPEARRYAEIAVLEDCGWRITGITPLARLAFWPRKGFASTRGHRIP